MADDLGWTIDKMKGIMADPKNIRSMQPGDSWVNPNRAGDARFVNEAEKVRPRGIPLHQKGGRVQTQDPMPPDQRKLADRLNINELLQGRDDQRMGGFGTSREFMPDPPVTVPMTTKTGDFARGGRVLRRK